MIIRWLHISDLHLGDDDAFTSRMRKQLPDFLREMGNFDYVFLTGDIRSANVTPNNFTQRMANYLEEICDSCGVTIDNLFIVPGNHDVNRDLDGRHDAIKRVSFGWEGYYNPRKGKIKDEDLTVIWNGQDEFREFLEGFYPDNRLSLYKSPLQHHFNIETEHFNLLHIDTSVIYTKGQESHNLIIGTYQLNNLVNSINKDKPTILLTHYPITSLLQDEKKVVGIILQENNVRLWLAGHEHDQVLQRIGYLDMLQAGELRYEGNASSSFLIGEYDPDTFQCEVRAYKWFDEGWSQYPYVDMDSDQRDVCRFELKPYNERKVSSLSLKARKANERFLHALPDYLDVRIIPKLLTDDTIEALPDLLIKIWNEDSSNLIILGEGGMGKTTLLLHYCTQASIPTLFISAEILSGLGISVEEYCLKELFDGDRNRYTKILDRRDKLPILQVIIDGLNEVAPSEERKLMKEIRRLDQLRGVQLIISSRADFTSRYNLPDFRRVTIRNLDEEILAELLSDEWEEVKVSPNLRCLLSNPMLFTIYREISTIIKEYRHEEFLKWKLPVHSATDLFYNYYLAQIALLMKRGEISGKKVIEAIITIKYLLPAIAYSYEVDFSLNKANVQFREILKKAFSSYDEKDVDIQSIREYYREFTPFEISVELVTDLLTEELHLMKREDGATGFIHQMYRDYMSARFLVNQSSRQKDVLALWNTRTIPYPIINHIKHSCGKYWNGIALYVKNEAVDRTDTKILIENIFLCFPSSVAGGVEDFSHLHLEKNRLPDRHQLPTPEKISVRESTISFFTLGLQQSTPPPTHLVKLSEDYNYLATACDNKIRIYNLMNNDNSPIELNIERKATQMLFYKDYLLVNAGNIIVYKGDEEWRYMGTIDRTGSNLFNSELKAIQGDGNVLTLRYDHQSLCFNLDDCSLYPQKKQYFEQIAQIGKGNLWQLRRSINLKAISRITDIDIPTACDTKDAIKAEAFIDGRIEIKEGSEIVRILGEKVPVLKDAAISSDGTIIVTLSGEIFGKQRRIIIWDPIQNNKLFEVFCDKSISQVDLSENGEWILGRCADKGRVWCFNIQTKEERVIEGSFLSSQYGKLSSFGNEIILRKEDGFEYLDLSTGEIRKAKCPIKNPRFVCPLRNGTLAGVSAMKTSFKFWDIWNNDLKTIYGDGFEIVSIQALREKPFISILDTARRISVYHTGTGQRLRKLDTTHSISQIAFHPSKSYIACTDGKRNLTIYTFDDNPNFSKKIGHWNSHKINRELESRILDFAFNAEEKALILILANGTIMYLDESNCKFRQSTFIITTFNPDNYDFNEIKSSDEVKEIIRRNTSSADAK